MTAFLLPQCDDGAQRKVSISARCIETDRQSCIPMHIPSSRTHHLPTNKNPLKKKETDHHPFPGAHTHTHTEQDHVHRVAPGTSHSSAPHTVTQLVTKDFAFIDKTQVRGQHLACSFVSDSLSLPPSEQQLSHSSLPPVCILTSGRWPEETVHFTKQGKGSNLMFIL